MQTPTLRQKSVVLTGAGISKESGLDTFRDKDNLYKKTKVDSSHDGSTSVLSMYDGLLHYLLHEAEHLVGHVAEGEVDPCACGHHGAAV